MRPALPMLLLVLATGCTWDLHRYGNVAFMPEPSQVVEVIEETPGVDRVDYRSFKKTQISMSGFRVMHEQAHGFAYTGVPNVRGVLVFVLDLQNKGSVEYSQDMGGFGRGPQARIAATRRVMLQIEARLEKTCGLTNLAASVRETRSGIKCR